MIFVLSPLQMVREDGPQFPCGVLALKIPAAMARMASTDLFAEAHAQHLPLEIVQGKIFGRHVATIWSQCIDRDRASGLKARFSDNLLILRRFTLGSKTDRRARKSCSGYMCVPRHRNGALRPSQGKMAHLNRRWRAEAWPVVPFAAVMLVSSMHVPRRFWTTCLEARRKRQDHPALGNPGNDAVPGCGG